MAYTAREVATESARTGCAGKREERERDDSKSARTLGMGRVERAR